jgi:hypothetical protein
VRARRPREGRVFRFCKQPLEVGENIRNERGPPRIFGGRRLRKQDQKITGLGHDFNPVGGTRGEKQVLKFLLALPLRGMVGVDRGELTAHPGRLLRGHPSSSRSIVSSAKFAHFQRAVGRPGENPVDEAVHSPVRPAGRWRCPVLTTNGWL